MDFIKNALKTILKAVFSACLVNIIVLILIGYLIGNSIKNVASESAQKLKKDTTLFIDTSMKLSDIALSARTDIIVSDYAKMSLLELYERILSAANDPLVDKIFLFNTKSSYNFNLSQSWAIKKALATFKESGKKVYAYLASPNINQKEYFLATVADEIWINPQSTLDFTGIYFDATFFGNAFEKYGIETTVVKCGKNKSFGDMFTRSEFSPETKADLVDIAKSLETYISSSCAKSKALNLEDFDKLKEQYPLLNAKKALENKLVDKIFYRDEVDTCLGVNSEGYNALNVQNYIPKYRLNKPKGSSNIAIVYMTGNIVEFSSDTNTIASSKYCKILKDIRKDKSIKATILVINSGGGSAYASEQIRREVALLSQEKETIAYVTSTCASGAYWIATACNKIYAQETSLVGSIGVFSLLFNGEKLIGDFGITFDTAKSKESADLFSAVRKPTEAEIAIMQAQVDEIYENFTKLVADSRKLDLELVKNDIATGSVWTSQKAMDLGLIDSADNNLPDTLRSLAKELNLDGTNYGVLTYPLPKTYGEFFSELLTGESSIATQAFMPKIIRENKMDKVIESFNDNTNLYLRQPFLLEEL